MQFNLKNGAKGDKPSTPGAHGTPGALREFLEMLSEEKKWLLLPLLVVAALALLASILYYTGVLEPLLAPFLYPIY
jgi:Family of unknown function (DUF5989)